VGKIRRFFLKNVILARFCSVPLLACSVHALTPSLFPLTNHIFHDEPERCPYDRDDKGVRDEEDREGEDVKEDVGAQRQRLFSALDI
jgi:hypothetical protein